MWESKLVLIFFFWGDSFPVDLFPTQPPGQQLGDDPFWLQTLINCGDSAESQVPTLNQWKLYPPTGVIKYDTNPNFMHFFIGETSQNDHMGVSINGGTPKWMVKIMENPIKMGDLGVKPTILGNPHISVLFDPTQNGNLMTPGPKEMSFTKLAPTQLTIEGSVANEFTKEPREVCWRYGRYTHGTWKIPENHLFEKKSHLNFQGCNIEKLRGSLFSTQSCIFVYIFVHSSLTEITRRITCLVWHHRWSSVSLLDGGLSYYTSNWNETWSILHPSQKRSKKFVFWPWYDLVCFPLILDTSLLLISG